MLTSVLILAGCGDDRPRVYHNTYDRPDMSREAYCRSIGLYKEWDSNDCETFADAYDLDEGSYAYKQRKAKYALKYPQYNKYNKVVYNKNTVIQNQSEVIAAQNAKLKRQKAELTRQQKANAKKNSELKKIRATATKKVEPAKMNFTKKPAPSKAKTSSYSKAKTSSYSKSSSSKRKTR